MNRQDVLKTPEYWISDIQLELYNCAEQFMLKTGKNRTQLAAYLGVTKGYVTQLLNGDYDHKLSKLVELSIAFGYIPQVRFTPIEMVLQWDNQRRTKSSFGCLSTWNNEMDSDILLLSA